VKHHIVVEKTDNSTCAADRCASLELYTRPISHLLAAHHPKVHVNREDYEDLELGGTSERRLRWVARVDEGRKLNEAAVFLLSVRETGYIVFVK
jgi:hypothetical protein